MAIRMNDDGEIEYSADPSLHSGPDSPYVCEDGVKYYYQHGLLSREDGPAVIHPNGREEWYLNGRHHRIDGPAYSDPLYGEIWMKNGVRHRTDGPAVVKPSGAKEWWVNGRLLRSLKGGRN